MNEHFLINLSRWWLHTTVVTHCLLEVSFTVVCFFFFSPDRVATFSC